MNEKKFSIIKASLQHYNHHKYWKMRDYVLRSGGSRILKLFYLFRIKRMDAFNGASLGTHFGYGAQFAEPPHFPHGIRGVFVSHNAIIGKNSYIFHQVTIGDINHGAPVIGNNVLIGPGAKILGKITVGSDVVIGANCVVVTDIPDNVTVVMEKPRILMRQNTVPQSNAAVDSTESGVNQGTVL